MNPVLFFNMFPFLKGHEGFVSDYTEVLVDSVVIDKSKTNMSLNLTVKKPVPPYELGEIERLIGTEFGFETVSITTLMSRKVLVAAKNTRSKEALRKKSEVPVSNTVILGKNTKAAATPMKDIILEDGKATILGEVCDISSKKIEKTSAWILGFDLTDYTGTIHVSLYLHNSNEKAEDIVNKIMPGMWLKVSGNLKIDRYSGDLALEPVNIVVAECPRKREDTAKNKRVELHLHTQMSALDALTNVSDVISRAHRWEHQAIAITDHGVVQSFPYAYAAASEYKDKIKIIYGLEGYFINDDDFSGSSTGRVRNRHIILLAKNNTGLKNLYILVTKSHLDYFHRFPIIKKSLLNKHRDGLILGSACEAGELFDAVLYKKSDEDLRKIASFYDYLEIQPVCNNAFLVNGSKPQLSCFDELYEINRKIYWLGQELGIPVVATGDVHFLDPEHEIYRHILLTSKEFEGARDDLPLFFRSTDEMLEEFSYLGNDIAYEVVIKNTQYIADMCQYVDPMPPSKKLFPPKLENSAEILTKLVTGNLAKLYGDNPPQIIINLLNTEMKDILSRNYDVIYVAAQKLVEESLKNGYIVGSRGSIGSSVVAYFMGITEVNALPAHYRCPKCKNSDFESGADWNIGIDMPDLNCPKCGEMYVKDGFNIPFETFLGFDGAKVPDIDLNFSGEFQAQAHKMTIELFGAENVYRAGTIGLTQFKTAYGYVKKYLEIINKSVTKAEESRLARGCIGVKRTTGQHPGGMIVIPRDLEITDFTPAQYPADSKEKEIITTHFEYKFLEDNLIKLDALGHDDPTMLKMLEDLTGIKANDIKLGEEETMAIFTSPGSLGLPENDDIIGKTGTIGIPEFGTVFTRQMLCDTKPGEFDTLIRLSGFSHGTDVWQGNAKDLIMNGIAGISETISCRDDIMLYLISKGLEGREAYSISESVRKGHGLTEEKEEKMIRIGVPRWYIESCKKIKYLFPKAHAVAYVIMAFRIAWFKVNKPLAFYSAYFYRRSQKDAFDANFMIHGINRVKSKIKEIQKNPDVKSKDEDLLTTLEACYEFYLRGFEFTNLDLYDSDPTKFLIIDEKKLRPPLVAVNGLGDMAAFDIAANRTNGNFISIEDISIACTKLTKTNLEHLKALGALRDLPDSSQLSMF